MFYCYSDGTITHLYAVCNTRGDVIELRAASGAIYATYTYDSWGRCVSVTNSSGAACSVNTVAVQNSIRYRGYVYDHETGLYYLQSRYYDPETGRFLNADDVEYIGYSGEQLSYNAFAYCENEPVNGWDPVGTLRFRTTVVAFSLDCLFTILGPSFKYGYDLVGATLKLIARKYGYKSFANKLLYSVVPKFRGLFSKFFTTIRTAIWRATGSFLSNTTNNFFVHIGKYISKLYNNGRYYTIYQYIATFLSAGSLAAAFMAWASTGNWLSNYIYL